MLPLQETPCKFNNGNNVYGSRDDANIKTSTLVDSNVIYYSAY
jgi:hypothetical protein